mgnify:CR=1 FL=1
MKNTLRKTLSLFLAFTLLCSLGLTAAASEAMGEDLTSEGTLLNQKTQLSTNVFWSTAYSDLRTENVVTYEPNADVTPIVTFGDSLTTRTTVTSAARALESQGYRVVAGINGDFFNTSNGLPIGILVSEGEVLSSDGGYYAMGFREDGSAVIGKPGLSISANLGYQGSDSSGYFTDIIRTVAGINKARVSTGGIYLYTYDFNNRHTTGNTEAGVDVLCTIVDGSLSIGGTMTLVVDQVIEATSATAIGPDQIVLSANALSNTYYTDALRNIPVGATVTVTVSAATVMGRRRPQGRHTGLYWVILSQSPPNVLPFAYNFIRFLPISRAYRVREDRGTPLCRTVRGTWAVSSYQVLAHTRPMPCCHRSPPLSRSTAPEISSCPWVTVSPGTTAAWPPRASTRVTSPGRRATTLAGPSSTMSCPRTRSTTCTRATQPRTFTASHTTSSSSSSTWLRMSFWSMSRLRVPMVMP